MRSRFLFPVLGVLGLIFNCLVASDAFAFPENVRHRYINCNSCHINPNGSGQLNPYGRQLSKAAQSYGKFFFEVNKHVNIEATAGAPDDVDHEVEFLYDVTPRPEWLQLGGDIRFLQAYINTPAFNEARFITMQADVEAAVTFGKLTVDATIGRDSPELNRVTDPGFSDYIVSRRHYALFQATDEVFFMGGRYWKPYGINDARHISLTKRGLGWDAGTESYNLQAGYQTANLGFTAYGDFGRPGEGGKFIEKGGGATAAIGILDSYKIGLSYFYGTTDFAKRHVFGPWGILGITEHLYLRTEHDFIRAFSKPLNIATSGYVGETRLGYEFVQGVHAYLEQQWGNTNLQSDGTRTQYYGIGMLYYPRPHWEFELNFQKQKLGAAAQPYTDQAYLQLHYYL